MEPDILARQCNSLKWYCFSDYWSKTSPGITKQKVLLPSRYIYIYIYIKLSFCLASKWIRLGIVYCFFSEQLTIHHCMYMVNRHKQNWNKVIWIIFVHCVVSVSLWCCKKIAHKKLSAETSYNYFCLIWTRKIYIV